MKTNGFQNTRPVSVQRRDFFLVKINYSTSRGSVELIPLLINKCFIDNPGCPGSDGYKNSRNEIGL
jgi:hypothetical protein